MRQIKLSILILFILFARLSYAQTNQDKAYGLGIKAVQKMDSGQVKESVKLLEQAIKLDPDNFAYPYEIAYAKYTEKDYKGAIKILEKIENYKNVTDRLYQMLGNSYDNLGKSDKAIETYNRGLKKFPQSGYLHLEMGILHINKNEFTKGLGYFEKGIYVAPNVSSNYYYAAKIYCSSTEAIWGMIYGEIFMNIERNTKRTSEISKLLYDTYKKNIAVKSDSSVSVHFSKRSIIGSADVSKLPYNLIYETTLLLSAAGEKTIDMFALDKIRTNFVTNYFKQEFNTKYPNVLFNYQNKVLKAGQLEAYNHWILMAGNDDEFENWYLLNKDKYDSFMKWFIDNGMRLDDNNKFYSDQY